MYDKMSDGDERDSQHAGKAERRCRQQIVARARLSTYTTPLPNYCLRRSLAAYGAACSHSQQPLRRVLKLDLTGAISSWDPVLFSIQAIQVAAVTPIVT